MRSGPDPQEDLPDLDSAGLVYVSDREPGITRRRSGKGFSYRAPDGGRLCDRATLARIRKLAIPPAYRDVWICTSPRGHLQATGRDQRGRKQYRYHPRWREVRDASKFARMAAFGRALPKIRARVAADLAQAGLTKIKVTAAVVMLLEGTLIRIGNDEYASANKSFGLTTLRKRHADVNGTGIVFEFSAKSGKRLKIGLRDRRLARIVRSCQDLPGHRLFQYFDEEGQLHPIDSSDVNAYLRDTTGEDFTAKDFRTWAGSVLAAEYLSQQDPPTSETAARHVIADCVRAVARELGNTPAICRKCYVHPEILAAYVDGKLRQALGRTAQEGPRPHEASEAALIRFLDRLAG